MGKIFDWEITPQDNLATQLGLAGYSAADVSKIVVSHMHADHVGGIGDVPQANLFVASDGWEHMMGRYPYREMVLRRGIADDVPLLLVGDLTYSQEMLEGDMTPANGDTKVLLESFSKVRGLIKTMPDLIVLPAHDLHATDKFRRSVAPQMARSGLGD